MRPNDSAVAARPRKRRTPALANPFSRSSMDAAWKVLWVLRKDASMTQHDDDDNNHIAGEHSNRLTTRPMGIVAGQVGSQPRFENISPKMVLRSDVPALVPDS